MDNQNMTYPELRDLFVERKQDPACKAGERLHRIC